MPDPSQNEQVEAPAVAAVAVEQPARAEADAKAAELAAKSKEPAQVQLEAGADVEFLGGLLAEAAKAMSLGGRARIRDVVVVLLLVANLSVMAFFALRTSGGSEVEPRQGLGAPAAKPPAPRGDDFQEAFRAAREKRHADAVRLFERHLKSASLPAEELLLVYQQLALQCRLAGRLEESVRYGAFAQSLGHKAWRAEDLLESAGSARNDGRLVDARRILARFLLMEASLPASARARVPKAVLQLAETCQEDAARPGGKKQ